MKSDHSYNNDKPQLRDANLAAREVKESPTRTIVVAIVIGLM